MILLFLNFAEADTVGLASAQELVRVENSAHKSKSDFERRAN